MTYKEAIDTYISRQKHSSAIIKRIMDWNPKISITENAYRMGITRDLANNFAQNYNLKYKIVGRGYNWGGVKCKREKAGSTV